MCVPQRLPIHAGSVEVPRASCVETQVPRDGWTCPLVVGDVHRQYEMGMWMWTWDGRATALHASCRREGRAVLVLGTPGVHYPRPGGRVDALQS